MRWLAKLEEGLVMFLMAAMTLLAFGQVIARFFFNYSFVWALEVTGVMFAWLIFIGMSYGVRVGAHIGVDAAVKLLPVKGQRFVNCIAAVLCIVYALIVVYGGTAYVMKMYQVDILMQDLPIPQWIPRMVLPIGFLLLAFRFSEALWRLATGQQDQLLGDEVEDAMKLQQVDPSVGGVK